MKKEWMFALLSATLIACKEPFNPVVEGQRPFTVFALLNTTVDTQVVRMHGSVLPSIDNPGYPDVPGASITILSATNQWDFRDTLVSTASGPIRAFFAPQFVPLPGVTYQLNVQSDEGNASAMTTVPSRCEISFGAPYLLQEPRKYPLDELIISTVALAPEAYGYLIRFIIEYERSTPGGWNVQYEEVPLWYRVESGPLYPEVKRRGTIVAAPGVKQTPEAAYYSNRTYVRTLRDIPRDTPIRWRRVLFIVSQTDRHFFSYYSLTNGFRDPQSIRLDRPDYTNVTGALGIFGSLTSDTLAIPLPSSIDLPDL